MSTHSGKNIHESLMSVLSGAATEHEINTLVRTAYTFASMRLRQLMKSGRLHLHSFNITIEGIAFDCIAELFQRNNDGEFIDLMDYFSGDRDIRLLSDNDAEHYFRRLVFSALNDGIFRLYRENDPILARIIRNLKIAVRANPSIQQDERLGQTIIFSCEKQFRNDQLPEYPIDEFQAEVLARSTSDGNTQDYLRLVIEALNTQERYRKFYPLIDIAVVLKRILVHERLALEQVFSIDEYLLESDVQSVLERSVQHLKRTLSEKYVQGNKICQETFDKYWLTLEEMIYDTFARNNGQDMSHPEYLKKQFPEMTTEIYRKVHRTHFEYMARVVKKYVREQLRELL